MTWQCRPDCESDCCGIVPLPKVTVKMFEHLKQRPVKEVLEVSDDEIIPFTDDMNCVFLSKDNKCVIYDSRPPVCRDYGIKPELQCPYIKMNGKPRSPAQVKSESSKGRSILSALEVYNIMKPLFAEADDVERMYCIFVNAKNRLIAIEKIADGTISRSMIYPREIIKRVIALKATGVVFVHNHPSGDPEPSMEDKNITMKLGIALSSMDVTLLDHVIHGRHDRFAGHRSGALGVQTLFELAVIDVTGQRPGDPGPFGQVQILSHGDMGDGTAFGNFTVGELVIEFES